MWGRGRGEKNYKTGWNCEKGERVPFCASRALAREADLVGGKRQGKGVLITGGSQGVLFQGNDT